MADSAPQKSLLLAKVCIIAADSFRRHLGELSMALIPLELEAAARFRRRDDAERFIIGRALIRHLCAIHGGCEPRAIEILLTASGKPYVRTGFDLEFNVSHSGGCVLIAWSTTGPVGVDVEVAMPGGRELFLEMAQRAFSPAEFAILRSAGADETAGLFYRTWVRKEALLKASGTGTGSILSSFSVLEESRGDVRWLDQVQISADGPIWRIRDLNAMVGHAAGIAVPAGTEILETPDVSSLSEFLDLARTPPARGSRQSGSNR